eukprot:12413590-Alexandrium_andersonii.AAC.1
MLPVGSPEWLDNRGVPSCQLGVQGGGQPPTELRGSRSVMLRCFQNSVTRPRPSTKARVDSKSLERSNSGTTG